MHCTPHIDEMYIKEDLVYDKYTGALVGFTNLGETNEHLLKVYIMDYNYYMIISLYAHAYRL